MEFLFIILAIGIVAVSIWAIVDVLRRPKTTFQQISQNKLLWVILLVVALVACGPAALALSIYYLVGVRPKLAAV